MHSGLVELSWSTYPTVAGEGREEVTKQLEVYKRSMNVVNDYTITIQDVTVGD